MRSSARPPFVLGEPRLAYFNGEATYYNVNVQAAFPFAVQQRLKSAGIRSVAVNFFLRQKSGPDVFVPIVPTSSYTDPDDRVRSFRSMQIWFDYGTVKEYCEIVDHDAPTRVVVGAATQYQDKPEYVPNPRWAPRLLPATPSSPVFEWESYMTPFVTESEGFAGMLADMARKSWVNQGFLSFIMGECIQYCCSTDKTCPHMREDPLPESLRPKCTMTIA